MQSSLYVSPCHALPRTLNVRIWPCILTPLSAHATSFAEQRVHYSRSARHPSAFSEKSAQRCDHVIAKVAAPLAPPARHRVWKQRAPVQIKSTQLVHHLYITCTSDNARRPDCMPTQVPWLRSRTSARLQTSSCAAPHQPSPHPPHLGSFLTHHHHHRHRCH